jgi:transcription elongation factor GreA
MAQPARAPAASWLISPAARDAVAAEADRLAADLAADAALRAGPGRPARDSAAAGWWDDASDSRALPVRLPARGGRERLTALRELLETAALVEDDGVVAIGRRVTLREEGGATWACSLVVPGDGDAEHGWVSAGSPLGSALLGRRAGDTVEVRAPGGRWPVTVVAVEGPTMLDACQPAFADPTALPAPRHPAAARRP